MTKLEIFMITVLHLVTIFSLLKAIFVCQIKMELEEFINPKNEIFVKLDRALSIAIVFFILGTITILIYHI